MSGGQVVGIRLVLYLPSIDDEVYVLFGIRQGDGAALDVFVLRLLSRSLFGKILEEHK
jgi:hypothetical protein